MGKRGPKPSGVEKAVFYRRVPKAQLESIERWFSEKYGVAVDASGARDVKEEVLEYGVSQMPVKDSGVIALLDDIENLTKENERLRIELEKARKATESEQVRYWQERARRAENSVRKGEFDQT